MIIVFGSINMDMNMRVKRFPEAGETVLSRSYKMEPGGKGANQALAAARVGAKTAIVGKIGDDGPGLRVLKHLKRNEVMTSGVARSESLPTGMAIATRERSGAKRLMVASGANAEVSEEQAPSDIFRRENVLLVQMEIPIEQNAIVMKRAHDCEAKVILNLAPALEIPDQMLALADYLIVNQIEARQLAQRLKIDVRKDAIDLAKAMAKQGNLTCIVTMGPEGIVAVNPDGSGYRLPAMQVEDVKDTAGAGDCFSGTFAACIHEGRDIKQALKMATVASGLSCAKSGVQESYPYLADIEEVMEDFAEVQKL